MIAHAPRPAPGNPPGAAALPAAATPWPRLVAAHQALGTALPPTARAALTALARQLHPRPQVLFHFVYVTENFDPARLDPALYRRRDPFDHPDQTAADFAAFAAAGLTEPQPGGFYHRATARGRAAYERRWQLLGDGLAALAPLPPADEARLLSLLERAVAATLAAPAPPPRWALDMRRQAGWRPDRPPAPLARLIGARMDLGAYRDDVHQAAWRAVHDGFPQEWEALTLLWREEADTAVGLARQLARRGVGADGYAAALAALAQRGWVAVAGAPDRYRLTPAGLAARTAAERQLDAWFYAPWDVLSAAELDTLSTLLRRLIMALAGETDENHRE